MVVPMLLAIPQSTYRSENSGLFLGKLQVLPSQVHALLETDGLPELGIEDSHLPLDKR